MKPFKDTRILIVLLCATMLLFSACKPSVANIQEGVGEVDFPVQIGEVTISESPTRVAVYSDSLADVLSTLGSTYELKLAARGTDCVHPNISVLPKAGTVDAPDTDKLTELKVTLILTDEAFSEENAEKLDKLNIQVLVIPAATNRSELITLYQTVASALAGGKTGYTAGEKRAKSLLTSLDDIERVIPKSETVLTGGVICDTKEYFATDELMLGKLLQLVGVTNIAADNGFLTNEALLTADPQVLFCLEGTKENILQSERYKETGAVKNNRVYEISEGCMFWQGNSLLTVALEMANALYPEIEGLSSDSTASKTSETDAQTTDNAIDETSSYADIMKLQTRLIELGYMQPPAIGVYTYWTRKTVELFQQEANLPVTGKADVKTLEIMFSEDSPHK